MNNQKIENCPTDERRAFWQFHLKEWQNTELSQAAYCRQHNLRTNQFTYWKKKLFQNDLPVEFVQLSETILHPADNDYLNETTASCLRLSVSSRFTIEIPDGFSPTTLAKTLMVLQEV